MKRKVIFALVFVSVFIALTGGAEAAHWITGTVNDAVDSTPADGHTAIIYYLGDEANYASDVIGPAGGSGTANKYLCDAEAIPGHVWVPGDEIYVAVIDTGDGYTAGPVSVVTTAAGFDVAPDMTLLLPAPPLVSDPEANPQEIVVDTGIAELQVTVTKTFFDVDTVTVDLSSIGGASDYMMYAKTNISADSTIYNCTTNASVVGNFSLTVNATDTKGSSNTSISIPLTVTEEVAVTLDYVLIKKAGSTGKNWISVPLDAGITNASSLMAAIGANCDAVNRWNPEEQKAEGWLSIGLGTNFDIVAGEGYEVSVTANTTFNLTGEPVDLGPIDLVKKAGSTGKNWVGSPYDTTMTNAASLMAAIGANCDAVNRWNPEEQKAEGWLSIGLGTNFDIVAGEGYEVSVTTNTTWTPT
jgi:hypothetical protein